MKIKSTVAALSAAVAVAGTLALVSTSAQAADCKHKVGSILSLTGSYGAYGVPISKAAQMGVEQVNAARAAVGVGCDLTYDVRDSQTQASVAIDAATNNQNRRVRIALQVRELFCPLQICHVCFLGPDLL